MLVECINNGRYQTWGGKEGYITVGNLYEVIGEVSDCWKIRSDRGNVLDLQKGRFREITEEEVKNMIMKAQVFDEKDTREFKVSTSKTEEALDAMKAIVTCADSDQVLFRWMVKGKWMPVTIRKSDSEWEDKLTQAFKDFVDKVKEVYTPAQAATAATPGSL